MYYNHPNLRLWVDSSVSVKSTDGWAGLRLSDCRAHDPTDLMLRIIKLVSHSASTYPGLISRRFKKS